MKVIKIEYSGGSGWLICHGSDYLKSHGATEAGRLTYIAQEAAEFVAEDIDGSDMLPARLFIPATASRPLFSVTCVTRDDLEKALKSYVPTLFSDPQARIEVRDCYSDTYTLTLDDMTVEECESLREFDGW